MMGQDTTIGKQFNDNKFVANFIGEDKPYDLDEREVIEMISPSAKSSYKMVVKHRKKLQPKSLMMLAKIWHWLKDSRQQG